jgi:hypothetical protein
MPLLKVNQIASYSGNTLTIGTTGDTVTLAAGASSSGFGATYNSGLNWTSTLVTSALTVSAGIGYFVNTSTAAITVTLPASPTFGSIIGIADYSGYASTNNITINPNGLKMEGATSTKLITTNKESVFLTYTDTTRGWLATSGVNNGTDALTPVIYSASYLIVAGGAGSAGSGSSGGGGGGGAGGLLSGTTSLAQGIVYTAVVGAGGAGGAGGGEGTRGTNGGDSSFTGITTAIGGGGGGTYSTNPNGFSGGSGGGGGAIAGSGGSGTVGQGNAGGNGQPAPYAGGGGGGSGTAGASGSGATGGNGGNGTASSITGSSVTYAGGGGGGGGSNGPDGSNGSGGGNTANLGGGGGPGGTGDQNETGGSGGSGVVILSVPTSRYSGTTTGAPTITTSGSNTIIKFTSSGTYTG